MYHLKFQSVNVSVQNNWSKWTKSICSFRSMEVGLCGLKFWLCALKCWPLALNICCVSPICLLHFGADSSRISQLPTHPPLQPLHNKLSCFLSLLPGVTPPSSDASFSGFLCSVPSVDMVGCVTPRLLSYVGLCPQRPLPHNPHAPGPWGQQPLWGLSWEMTLPTAFSLECIYCFIVGVNGESGFHRWTLGFEVDFSRNKCMHQGLSGLCLQIS